MADPSFPYMSASRPWWKELTRYQWLVLLVAWLGWVFDIMDTALFNFAKGPMLAELFHNAAELKQRQPFIEGYLLTVLLVGWSVGGLFFGVLADKWGRARTMTVTVLIYCVFTGLTAFCRSWEQVVAIRFITALGIGGEWAAGTALLAETFPDKARAPGAAMIQSAAAIGPWFAAIANLAIPAANWRWLFLLGVFPAIITLVIRFGIREPERWKAAEAKDRGNPFSPLAKLFSNSIWRRHAVVALVLGVVGIAAAGNISFWLPNLVKAASDGLPADVVKDRTSYVTLVMHVGTLLGVFVVPWLCERIGRRPTLLIFFLASPVSVVAATLLSHTYGVLMLMAPVMSFFTIGLSAAFVLYFPELFPTALRATGIGFAYNTGRIFAAGIPLLTGYFISSGSVMDGVGRTALVLLLGVFALGFAPETRGQPLPQEA